MDKDDFPLCGIASYFADSKAFKRFEEFLDQDRRGFKEVSGEIAIASEMIAECLSTSGLFMSAIQRDGSRVSVGESLGNGGILLCAAHVYLTRRLVGSPIRGKVRARYLSFT